MARLAAITHEKGSDMGQISFFSLRAATANPMLRERIDACQEEFRMLEPELLALLLYSGGLILPDRLRQQVAKELAAADSFTTLPPVELETSL
jgi:hypothetical protein